MQQQLAQGWTLQQNGQLAQAIMLYQGALKSQPRNFDALHLLGMAAAETGNFTLAVDCFTRALKVNPVNAAVCNKRGIALQELGQLDAALSSYDKAIALQPDFAGAYGNRGVVLHELRQWNAALDSLNRAIMLQPSNAGAYYNRANLLRDMRQLDSAWSDYEQVLRLRPDDADAHHNRGIVLQELQRWDAALESQQRAYALRPDIPFLAGDLMHTRMHLCDWDGWDITTRALIASIGRGEKVSPCFPLLAVTDSTPLLHAAARLWSRARYPSDPALGPITPNPGKDKIRVGYFSTDFKMHPVALLLAGMLESHDRTRFEIFAFSLGPDTNDSVRQRVSAACDHFIDVQDRQDSEVAMLSRRLEIDIAVDLGGYTTGMRTGIFARRAAPIQVNFLGYPGTLGTDYMDYLIADHVVIPAANRQHYSEKIAYLDCFMPQDNKQQISEQRFHREDFGLPATGFVFCCFNNAYKVTPRLFDCWMRILAGVPDSVLWLSVQHESAVRHLRKRATACGIDETRLVTAPRMPAREEHLARLRLADLFLDTTPYNAHATASDALWAGLPVLTCMGQSFASRVAGSLLSAIGLTQLITHSLVEYESRAMTLALDPAELPNLRLQLARNRHCTPLFDTSRHARGIEAAYSAMAERYQKGLPPDTIDVTQ